MSASPPPRPPLLASATTTRTSPASQPRTRRARAGGRPASGRRAAAARPRSTTRAASGISAPDTSPIRNSCEQLRDRVRVEQRRRRRRCARCRAAGRARRSPRARGTTAENSRPIRLWSVEVNHAATDAGNDPIADSPRAAPTASGLDSIVVMYVGLACRACRGETSNGHGGPTRPDITRPPASGRKSQIHRDCACRPGASRHTVTHEHVEGHRAEQHRHVGDASR